MIRRRRRSRGQSLVEFALVLPILLMLTLITLDFGRIYLGYINLQNMARIASNFAANNPDAWDATPDAAAQTRYKNQILADAVASNCVLPKVAGVTTVPVPTFIDTNGNGSTTDLGDTAEVQISCTFGVITPGIANIVGGSVTVSAASSFPVKSGMSATGAGGPPGSALPPSAAFSGNGTISPSPLSGIAPFVVEFRDTSGGGPSTWAWDFGNGTTSTARDPLQREFAFGIYDVSMTASNAFGSSLSRTMRVTVGLGSAVNFTANLQSGNAPLTVQFTDASTSGGTAYAWTFGTEQGTSTLQNPSWNYTTPGTYTVTLTVTYPSPDGDMITSKTGFITVNVAQCLVPSLNGVRRNDAPGIWQGAPYNFTGTVSDSPGAPQGNYIITTQSLVAGASASCTSNVVVNRPR